MTGTVEQARAVLAIIERGTAAGHDRSISVRALSLARELLICGESRLALELSTACAQSGSDVIEYESHLIRARSFMSLGNLAEVESILDALAAIPDLEKIPIVLRRQWTLLRACQHWYRLNFRESLEILTALRSQLLAEPESAELGWCSHYLGNAAWSLGDIEAARRYLTEAAASAYRNQDLPLEALTGLSTGMLKRSLCHWGEAREEFKRAAQLFTRIGHQALVGHARMSAAIVDLKRGRLEAAYSCALEVVRTAAATGTEESRCFAEEVAAQASLHEGNIASATTHIRNVLDSISNNQSSRHVLIAREILADIELDAGHP